MVKKALCVGLNYPDQSHQLYGCINDCLNWAQLLEKTFEFEECRVLIDQSPQDGSVITAPTQVPTAENILAQLNWLCSGASPGDCLAFVYAGLGMQVRIGEHVEEALVPVDNHKKDSDGNPRLVFEDEVHALFNRLPSGSFLTVILDTCHATHMLDVPCWVDSHGAVQQNRPRPVEVHGRKEDVWVKNPHAYARPRFHHSYHWKGKRTRRTPEGSGQHVGQMNLNPGVTALAFAACNTDEVALDASVKAHQQGIMSFCLQEALTALQNRCTYEQLLVKASQIADDIRTKYMPTMDQNIHLSFCPNSAPSEVVFLDARYATVAQHRLSQQAKRGLSTDNGGGTAATAAAAATERPPAVKDREVSSDFVPAPAHSPTNQKGRPQQVPPPGVGGVPPGYAPPPVVEPPVVGAGGPGIFDGLFGPPSLFGGGGGNTGGMGFPNFFGGGRAAGPAPGTSAFGSRMGPQPMASGLMAPMPGMPGRPGSGVPYGMQPNPYAPPAMGVAPYGGHAQMHYR